VGGGEVKGGGVLVLGQDDGFVHGTFSECLNSNE
jgi:hypothetical protein